MSCEENRQKYWEHVCASSPGVLDTPSVLEHLYQTHRVAPTSQAEKNLVTAKTQALFAEMEKAGITPPTHAASGLPHMKSRAGYAFIFDALKEARVLPDAGGNEFFDYAEDKRDTVGKRKIPSAISQRWKSRVVAQGMDKLPDQEGATAYIRRYAKTAGAKKLVHLALKAEAEGCDGMALGFWQKAYEVETGKTPPADFGTVPAPAAAPVAAPAAAPAADAPPEVPGLVSHLQPGHAMPMLPIDAPRDRQDYVDDDDYWGQPKRDGHHQVVSAGSGQAFYQSRNLSIHDEPTPEIHAALTAATQEFGTFVLDGEQVWLDVKGGEHRSAAQAATANVNLGQGTVQPVGQYAIFKALFADGNDLTAAGVPESDRIEAGEKIGAWLVAQEPDAFEVVPTARTDDEKAALVKKQKAEGREGEIWVQHRCSHVKGKSPIKDWPPLVRTKYLQSVDVVVLKLIPSDKVGRPFKSVEVGIYDESGTLRSIGKVGSGFNAEEMAELVRRHKKGETIVLEATTQGFTENGKLWHPRFTAIRTDKKPEDCVEVV